MNFSSIIQISNKYRTKIIYYIILLLLLLLAISYYIFNYYKVYTENAYIKTDFIAVSPEITGRIAKVLVQENDHVKKGDVLFEIDAEPFQLAVDNLQAQLQQIKNNVDMQKAIYQQKKTNVDFGEKDIEFYKAELERQADLFKKKFASAEKRDQAQHNLDQAQQRLQSNQFDMQSTLAYLGGNPHITPENHPQYLQIKAQLDKAKLDLRRTVVTASEEGVVTRISLVVGDQITSGVSVFTIYMPQNVWIEANFKEIDLENMKAGQKAKMWVDAYPSQRLNGYIEQIGMAAGSEYAILPAQNATGNWVKVVQRIPVRLRINKTENTPVLRAGMSIAVEVDTSSSPSVNNTQ